MTKLVSTAIAAALLCSAGAGHAQPADGRSAAIQTADLNLATPSGLATFHGRVKAAANRICGHVPVAPLEEALAVEQCRDQMFRSAADQLASARSGRSDALGTR